MLTSLLLAISATDFVSLEQPAKSTASWAGGACSTSIRESNTELLLDCKQTIHRIKSASPRQQLSWVLTDTDSG